MMTRRLPTSALSLSLLLLVACGTDNGYRNRDLPSRPQSGEVQFINLMPDSPSVKAEVGTVNLEVDFGHASQLTRVVMGDYQLSISYLDADGEKVYIIDHDDITLDDEDQYVYVLSGSILQPQVERTHFIDPQFAGPIPDDMIEVWITNALSAAREVDVYLTEPDVALDAATPLASIATGGTTETMREAYSATLRLRVTDRGSTSVLFDSGVFPVAPRTRSLIALVDYFGPTSTTLFTPAMNVVRITSAGDISFANSEVPSQLRVIDLVPDVPSLDVYLGSTSGAPLFAAVAPSATTGYVDIKAGARALNVTRAGVKNQFIAQDDLAFSSGQYYTLALSGRAADDSVFPLVATTTRRPVLNRVHLNFIYGTVTPGTVNVYLLNPGQDHKETTAQFSGVTTGGFRTLSVRPALYDVVITTADGASVLLGPERLNFAAGISYSLVLVDEPVGSSASLRLMLLQESG